MLTFDIPESDIETDILISLAPQRLSESDALKVAGQLGRARELIREKPATVAGLIKEFNDKTRGMGYDIMKYLRTGDLGKDED